MIFFWEWLAQPLLIGQAPLTVTCENLLDSYLSRTTGQEFLRALLGYCFLSLFRWTYCESLKFATLIVRVTLILLFFFLFREINGKRKFHVIKYVPSQGYGFWAFLVWKRLYTLHIFVWNRVLFSRELLEWMDVVFISIPNEEGNRNRRIRNAFEELFCLRSNLSNDDLINA